MNRMTKPAYDVVLDLLKRREGVATDIMLDDGRTVRSQNIAWSFDLGNPVAHLTINVSPLNPESNLPIDSFFADEVVRIVDPENGAELFERPPSSS